MAKVTLGDQGYEVTSDGCDFRPKRKAMVKLEDETKENLLNVVENLRETNRKLHRRVPVDENQPEYAIGYRIGYERGVAATTLRLEKEFEKKLADYKHGTRKEVDKLRRFASLWELHKQLSPDEQVLQC